MKGFISFHPVDPTFFEQVVAPLVGGARVNLDGYLDEAIAARRSVFEARRFVLALAAILEAARPPKLEPIVERPSSAAELLRTSVHLFRSPEALLKGIKTRLDRMDHRLDELSKVVLRKVEPDLHLLGRPYFVAEASPSSVADAVDRYRKAKGQKAVLNLATEQLMLLDQALSAVEPHAGMEMSADLSYRSEIFRETSVLSEIPAAVKRGAAWAAPDGERRSATEALREEAPWIAVRAHARVVPFWIARDVDGLATMCKMAEINPPAFLGTATRLFAAASAAAPEIGDGLGREIERGSGLGAYVAPEHVGDLLVFLVTRGATIIRVAARMGEGNLASVLLKKIRECAVYAERHKLGYLEASGILPPGVESLEWIREAAEV